MNRFEDLSQYLLRPPGGGIPAFSAGVGAAERLQLAWYGIEDPTQIEARWRHSLRTIGTARVAILGVPSDTGAGIRRGAAYGPRAVRSALLDLPEFRAALRDGQVLDLGDVYCNPHLLEDQMLSDAQIRKCQEAMYPQALATFRHQLPVSPLSQTCALLEALKREYPQTRLFVIGGDHSVAWPVSQVLAGAYPGTLGIVQPDAHTDLLEQRLGVDYCFGTWSFHANKLIGGGGRMVQIGTRQTGHPRAHWETTTGVRQYWPAELVGRTAKSVIDDIVAGLKAAGVEQVYFSNDIDGTDESEASATGTPADAGIGSEFFLELIPRLGQEFELVAADVMEVAPDLGPTPEATQRTCDLAAKYAWASMQAMM
jgi:agmatinase